MARILVTLALALYNNVANLWPPFNPAAYVPANLLAAGALLVTAIEVLDLSVSALGLSSLSFVDVVLGAAVGTAIAAPLFALGRSRRWAHRVADRRVTGLRGGALVYQV